MGRRRARRVGRLGLVLAWMAGSTLGCSTVRTITDAALGRGGKEARELERLQRVERAQRLGDAQIERRLAFLTERLDDNFLHAAMWKYGWLFINGAGSAAATAQAIAKNDDLAFHTMRAVKGAIGVIYLLINPMPGTRGADPIREMPSATLEERRAQLIAAEDLLATAAERTEQRFAVAYHVANLLFNAAAAGAVAATGDHSNALQALLIDTAAGEVQVWTQPWEPPAQWEEYERLAAADEPHAAYDPPVRWAVVPHGGGLGVRVDF